MAEIETGDVKQAPGAVKLQLLRAIPVLVVLGLLVHFVLPRLGTIQESFQTLRRMLPWALAAAILAECFSYVANGMVLRSVVALAGERLRLGRACAIARRSWPSPWQAPSSYCSFTSSRGRR